MMFRLRILIVLISLGASQLPAQTRVGLTTSSEGTTERLPTALTEWTEIEEDEDVELADQLRTAINSKLGVGLTVGGHHFTLGASVLLQVAQAATATATTTLQIELILQTGSLRVITGPTGSAPIVTRAPSAAARAKKTGYLVSCGPPETSAPGECLFLGVYGETEVTPTFTGASPILLLRQQFTIVGPDSASAVEQMDAQRFRRLLDQTTIVGTGSDRDRIALNELAPLPPATDLIRPPLKPRFPDPSLRVPADPEPPARLPDPPPPPRPPE